MIILSFDVSVNFLLFISNLLVTSNIYLNEYIFEIEDFIGAKISSISTSPKREDTILIENPFDL